MALLITENAGSDLGFYGDEYKVNTHIYYLT